MHGSVFITGDLLWFVRRSWLGALVTPPGRCFLGSRIGLTFALATRPFALDDARIVPSSAGAADRLQNFVELSDTFDRDLEDARDVSSGEGVPHT